MVDRWPKTTPDPVASPCKAASTGKKLLAECLRPALRPALRIMAADHRPRCPQVPPLRRPLLRLRPRPLPGSPARDVRGLLLPPTLLVPQLPSETHPAGRRHDCPHRLPSRSPPATGLHHPQTAPPGFPLRPGPAGRTEQRLSIRSRHGRFAGIGPIHPALSVQPGPRGPPDRRRIGPVSGRTGPLPPLPRVRPVPTCEADRAATSRSSAPSISWPKSPNTSPTRANTSCGTTPGTRIGSAACGPSHSRPQFRTAT